MRVRCAYGYGRVREGTGGYVRLRMVRECMFVHGHMCAVCVCVCVCVRLRLRARVALWHTPCRESVASVIDGGAFEG